MIRLFNQAFDVLTLAFTLNPDSCGASAKVLKVSADMTSFLQAPLMCLILVHTE